MHYYKEASKKKNAGKQTITYANINLPIAKQKHVIANL